MNIYSPLLFNLKVLVNNQEFLKRAAKSMLNFKKMANFSGK